LAEEASGSSQSAATEQTESLISDAKEESDRILAEATEVAKTVRDEADADAETKKEEAEQILMEATAAAEARSAEIVVREAELEQLAAIASSAGEEAAATLETARDGAEALRNEAQELRDEANAKRDEAQSLIDEAQASAEAKESEIAATRDQLENDAKEIEASIVIRKAEAAEAEDASVDAAGRLDAIKDEILLEEERLAAAKTAVEAELEDLKLDMAELRSSTMLEVEAMQSNVQEQEGSADDVVAAATEQAAQIVAQAEARAAEIDAAIESGAEDAQDEAGASLAAAAEAVLADAQAEADRLLADARSEADRMEAATAASLQEAAESGAESTDAAEVEAMLSDVVAREWEVARRENAVTVREETAERSPAIAEPAVLAGVSQSGAIGADGWPTGPPTSTPPQETDSIDAIRREAMAALDESRMSDEWTGDDTPASSGNGAPKIDYTPSVQPRPKPSKPAKDSDGDEVKEVESRYRRNSAKLPRIGIEPGTSSDAIANLRKKIVSND
jgi:hypothetical protein